MNLYSRFLLMVFSLCFSLQAQALNVKALYTAACKRELGLILNVDDQHITFLSMQKAIIKIPRYELIYMADYPIDRLPTQGALFIDGVPKVKITTMDNHKELPLLQGFPIGFNAEKISFLKSDGAETVIDSENIWSIEFLEATHKVASRRAPKNYRFIHPYAFRACGYSNKGRKIYPQQILSDPIQIKRELDVLGEGFDRVRRYEREQDFYPVPQVFENKTELGIWYSFGSRAGASDKRSNNLLPVLVDQYSSDIFDYQHYSVTGSAPLLIGTHEEPQPQIYYTFKASYFHFSIMVDPDLVLVGENYEWQSQDFDLDKADTRHNDVTIVELGFDFGNFSFRAYGGSVINIGIWDGTTLIPESFGIPRFGLKYSTHRWWAEFNTGNGSKTLEQNFGVLDASINRFNLGINDIGSFDFVLTYIGTQFEAPRFNQLDSTASTFALYFSTPLSKRVRLGGFTSMEAKETQTATNSFSDNFLKAGASIFLNF